MLTAHFFAGSIHGISCQSCILLVRQTMLSACFHSITISFCLSTANQVHRDSGFLWCCLLYHLRNRIDFQN